MGIHNVRRAALADTTPAAKVVLLAMAMAALDPEGKGKAEPLHYYGGWERLALALGHYSYGPTAERQVARAMRELVCKRYVTPVDRTRQGVRVYRLSWLPDDPEW